MKIAVVSSGLGHVTRGAEVWADTLADALDRRKENVFLFKGGGKAVRGYERVIPCLRRDSAATRRFVFLTRHFFWRWGLGSAYGIEQITFAANLMPVLAKEKFQIIHTQDPLVALFLERRGSSHGSEVILAHGTEEDFGFLLNFKHVQELAPQYLEEDRRRGLPGGRCWFAIPNFVDCEKFKPQDALRVRRRLDIPEGKFIILEVAAVKSSHKRIDYLIGEAALLRKKYPEVFVIVAGAQTIETSRLITMGKEQFGDNIRFLLNRPSDEMPDIYAAADIFAHSALFEMMPIALLESLSSGLPVIANKNPVFDWIIAGGGRTVDIQKSGSLAAAIEEYIKRPEIRAESSSAARRQALMNFEASRVTEQIVAMYENILKNER